MDIAISSSTTVEELLASNLSYAQAVEHLEAIGRGLSSGAIALEELEGKVAEMDLLLRFCVKKLGLVQGAVGKVMESWKPLLDGLNE